VDRSAPAPLAMVKELLAATSATMDKPTRITAMRTSIRENPWQTLLAPMTHPLANKSVGHLPVATFDILKIGRMMLMAMKPTSKPITTIMIGSIIDVTALMTAFNSRL